MTVSIKTKAVLLCALIFIIGFACGFVLKNTIYKKRDYGFQYNFEKLEPLTKELALSDVQKALIFNILADNKKAIDAIMKPVNPKINVQLHIMRENIRNILDEAQKDKYSILLKAHEARRVEQN